MPKTFIIAQDLKTLKRTAKRMKHDYVELLSAILDEMTLLITDDVIDRVRAIAAPVDVLAITNISVYAKKKLLKICDVYKVPDYAVVSYILADSLESVEDFPETLMGLKYLNRPDVTCRQRTMQVGISNETITKLRLRMRALIYEDHPDNVPSVSMRINLLLSTLNRTEVLQRLMSGGYDTLIDTGKPKDWKSVRITYSNYDLISSLSSVSTRSRASILSALIEDDLQATEIALTMDQPLSTSTKREWQQTLNTYITHVAEAKDE